MRLVELEAQIWLAGLGRPLASMPDQLVRLYREMNLAHLQAWHAGARPTDSRTSDVERLDEIAAPTLVVTGDADVPEVQEEAALIAAKVPGASRRRMRDAGHLAPLEKPREFTALLLDWLTKLPQAL